MTFIITFAPFFLLLLSSNIYYSLQLFVI